MGCPPVDFEDLGFLLWGGSVWGARGEIWGPHEVFWGLKRESQGYTWDIWGLYGEYWGSLQWILRIWGTKGQIWGEMR